MDYYIDLTIEPDEEVPIFFIRNKVYTKLHKALHSLNANDIGVSFPNYQLKLGDVIRLHASESRLNELQATNWLGGLAGYCNVSEIQVVPSDAKYRTVSRKQPTMTLAKLEKRINYQTKQGILKTEDDINAYKKQYKAKMYGSHSLDNPYLELQSTSSGQLYRVFIEMGEIQDNPISEEFNYFGLSKTATIPWF